MHKIKKDYPKVPPGGWHFPETGTVLSSGSLDGLIEEIKAYRLRNSMSEGKPEYEVTLYYAANFPDFVEQVEGIESEDRSLGPDDYLYSWVNLLWKTPRKILALRLAQTRVETCRVCRWRNDWKVSIESPKSMEIGRKLYVLSAGAVHEDGVLMGLGYCAFHQLHAGLLCVIKDPPVAQTCRECWVGKPDLLTDSEVT